MINAVIILLALIFAVVSHEYGHMVMTKMCGVPVPEFGIGFGKKITSFKINGTRYRVRMIPLGGYVKPDYERFADLPIYKKTLVYLAGPLVNIGSAAVVLWIYWMSVGIQLGKQLDTLFFKAWEASFMMIGRILEAIGPAFKQLGAEAFMGPIGAVGMAAQSTDTTGLYNVLMVVMILLSLGIFNLLPIPALDGGQVMMTTLRVPVKIYKKASQAGMYALLGAGGLIMIWDIYRIITGTLIVTQ